METVNIIISFHIDFIFNMHTDLIVIHNGVEGLNPHRVNIPVQNNPFGSIVGHWGQLSHGRGEQT